MTEATIESQINAEVATAIEASVDETELQDSDFLKFEVDQKTFASTLNKCFLGIEPKHYLLKSFLIEIDSDTGNLNIVSFNQSIGVVCLLPVMKLSTNLSKFCVDAASLRTLINNLPSNLLKVSLAAKRLTITSGKNKYKLDIGRTAADFPELPRQTTDQISVELDTLESGLERVMFAAAPDMVQGVTHGVRIKLAPDTLSFAGCQSHMFSMLEVAVEIEGSAAVDITVPLPSIKTLKTLMGLELRQSSETKSDDSDTKDDLVKIQFEKSSLIRFTFLSGTEFISRLYAEAYPPVENLFAAVRQQGFNATVAIDRKKFIGTLERIKMVAELTLGASAAKDCGVLCIFGQESAHFKLSQGDDHRIDEELECLTSADQPISEPVQMIFGVAYLLSVLKAFKSGSIELKLLADLTKCLFGVGEWEQEGEGDEFDPCLICLLASRKLT